MAVWESAADLSPDLDGDAIHAQRFELGARIGDRVWHDPDGDGVQEDGESGVEGVVDWSGIDTTRDAGLVPGPRIGDRIWNDFDGNGIQNGGESGMAGVTVRLYREPDPPFRAATLVAAEVTDADGHYSFAIEPGTFYLELLCDASEVTALDQGTDDELDSDFDPFLRTTSPFTIESGTAVSSTPTRTASATTSSSPTVSRQGICRPGRRQGSPHRPPERAGPSLPTEG